MRRISSLAWSISVLLFLSAYLSLTGTSAQPRLQVMIADSFGFPIDNPTRIIGYDVHPSYSKSTCFGVDIGETWHAGEDWFASAGTTVMAVANGTVVYVHPEVLDYPGSVVIVEHVLSGGERVYSMYGHLREPPPVSTGQDLTKGDTIGYVLDQGSNSHLHWETRNFVDGSFICNNRSVPGPGHTYPEHPDFPIAGNFDTGYTGPSAYINYSEIDDQVILFEHTFYRGLQFPLQTPGFYNLPPTRNDKTSSIVIPRGWRAMVYKHVDRGGGPNEKKLLHWNDVDFRNDQFFDGTPLNDNISSTEIITPGGCDPRISAIDTTFPNGVPGAKDGNIDFFEASLYVNNYDCSLTGGQPACDSRIPLEADGALNGNPDGYIDFGEVTLAINNYDCGQLY